MQFSFLLPGDLSQPSASLQPSSKICVDIIELISKSYPLKEKKYD